MSIEPKPLFQDNPLLDLAELVKQARELNARRLLLLAGKHPVCRVEGKLSPPLRPQKMHFNQMESLANALLSSELHAELDANGSVEIKSTIAGEEYQITVFFGDGSHNVVVFLA